MKTKIDVQEISFHRNGICGESFFAVRFKHRANGPRKPAENFLATVFAKRGHVSVISLDRIADTGVAFGCNSWRGDQFEDLLREEIACFSGS